MTVFLLRDADGLGDGEIDIFSAMGDLIVAANDTGVGFGDAVDGRIPVTYARSENGPTHVRLDDLINGDFDPDYGDGPQPVDIVIVSVPDNFVLADGTFGITNNGTALPPSGSGLPGDDLNSTTDCLVLYDGQLEVCVARDGTGGTLDLSLSGPAVLYHELSHAFRIVRNELLDLSSTCNPSSPEENAAIVDENDMRTMLADLIDQDPILRDPGIHCGGLCGGTAPVGGCCIVASVASGSPCSAQVQHLRAVRDQFLRRTETGFYFFEWLHHDYYAFSPQVATMLASDLALRHGVLEGYVEPLIDFWSFMVERAEIEPCSAVQVGEAFASTVPPDADRLRHRHLALEAAAGHLLAAGGADRAGFADDALVRLLHERAWTSEVVRWALIEPVAIYAQALGRLVDGDDVATVGAALIEAIDPWVARLPIHPVWGSLPRLRIDEELAVADQLLGTPTARRAFRARLAGRFPRNTAVARLRPGPGQDESSGTDSPPRTGGTA